MKTRQLFLFFLAAITCCQSCKKTGIADNPDALLFTSADALHFDTVFTGTGSVTQSFKIFNPNDGTLRISNIELAGGSSSFFAVNVDGTSGTVFSNIEIAPDDSIYVFVAVNIDPGNGNNPFLVQDSIRIVYNTNETIIQLDAYGQNARFLKDAAVTKDTAWDNHLPFVISGNLLVNAGSTLTIERGARIYFHAGAALTVDGTLIAAGEKYDSTNIIFRSDRLDEYYRDLPGNWEGIVFTEKSRSNKLAFVSVLNASNALVVQNPALDGSPKLIMAQCRVDKSSGTGIYGINSSIQAVNCLVSNCGSNIRLVAGGNYQFSNCTAAAYSNLILSHEQPVLFISNINDNGQVFPLAATFTNSIFWGEDGFITDEIVLELTGDGQFSAVFDNVLYKGSAINGSFTNSIQNEDPYFAGVDAEENSFDFHLQGISPCINKGKTGITAIDLDGNNRDGNPDIGCYEYAP